METAPAKSALFAALSAAQAEFPAIPRTREIRVTLRSGGGYVHSYAELGDVLRAVRPALGKHGLAYWDAIEDGPSGRVLRSTLAHREGGEVSSVVTLPAHSTPQELGSAVTYIRRYQAQAMLGISTEDDAEDGAAVAGDREVAESRRREPRPAQRPPSERPKAPDLASADQMAAVKAEFDRLGTARSDRSVICHEITGESPAALSAAGAAQLLVHLRGR